MALRDIINCSICGTDYPNLYVNGAVSDLCLDCRAAGFGRDSMIAREFEEAMLQESAICDAEINRRTLTIANRPAKDINDARNAVRAIEDGIADMNAELWTAREHLAKVSALDSSQRVKEATERMRTEMTRIFDGKVIDIRRAMRRKVRDYVLSARYNRRSQQNRPPQRQYLFSPRKSPRRSRKSSASKPRPRQQPPSSPQRSNKKRPPRKNNKAPESRRFFIDPEVEPPLLFLRTSSTLVPNLYIYIA